MPQAFRRLLLILIAATDGRGERMKKFMRELEAERAEEAAKQNK